MVLGKREPHGLAVFTGTPGPEVQLQAGKGRERHQEDAGPGCWRPPHQRPWCRVREGVEAGRLWKGRRMEQGQCRGKGQSAREDLRQGRREKQGTQGHWAMSCSPFSAGTIHSLNLTYTARERRPHR